MRLWSPTDSEFDISLGVCQRQRIVCSASNIDQIQYLESNHLPRFKLLPRYVQVYRAPLPAPPCSLTGTLA